MIFAEAHLLPSLGDTVAIPHKYREDEDKRVRFSVVVTGNGPTRRLSFPDVSGRRFDLNNACETGRRRNRNAFLAHSFQVKIPLPG